MPRFFTDAQALDAAAEAAMAEAGRKGTGPMAVVVAQVDETAESDPNGDESEPGAER